MGIHWKVWHSGMTRASRDKSREGPKILAIETSSRVGSLALAVGDELLVVQEFRRNLRHVAELLPAAKDRGPIMVTSEIDLLVAGISADQLDEIDFKRWKRFTAEAIAKAFQFRLHAWLVFRHYPEVETLRARLADAEQANTEATTLRAEREHIRTRVTDMLERLDAIDL